MTTMRDVLKNAGVKASKYRSYTITPQEAAKRFKETAAK